MSNLYTVVYVSYKSVDNYNYCVFCIVHTSDDLYPLHSLIALYYSIDSC